MPEQLPAHQLLDEYGLNQVTFKLLGMADAATEPLTWAAIKPIAAFYKITGNPAPALRKLVDRGLLTGPARNEDIKAKPFALTDAGRDILARIQRGLHRPRWISPAKAKILRLLTNNYHTSENLKDWNIHPASMALASLTQAGYIQYSSGHWRLTPLGLEAWAEYLVTTPLGKGPGESQANSPTKWPGEAIGEKKGGEG